MSTINIMHDKSKTEVLSALCVSTINIMHDKVKLRFCVLRVSTIKII